MGAIYVFGLTRADMSAELECGRELDRRRKLDLVAGPRACKISIDSSSFKGTTALREAERERLVTVGSVQDRNFALVHHH